MDQNFLARCVYLGAYNQKHRTSHTSVSVSDKASSRLRLRDGFIFSNGGCSPCWKDQEEAVSPSAKSTIRIKLGKKNYDKMSRCLTGLKVSRPKLPLLFRLPISVWELDWDIPSKNGLIEERQE